MAFKPNALTFQEGIDRINKARQQHKFAPGSGVVTSRDAAMKSLIGTLAVTNIPAGFKKWQLPVFFLGGPGTQFFISVGAPDTDVPQHSHDEGDGIRVIVSGSVIYNDVELTAGDWMFIPKGTPYALRAGETGAVICYCYQCCCA